MKKASTRLPEQGTQTPSPAPDLIPAETKNQPRTYKEIGTANGGISSRRKLAAVLNCGIGSNLLNTWCRPQQLPVLWSSSCDARTEEASGERPGGLETFSSMSSILSSRSMSSTTWLTWQRPRQPVTGFSCHPCSRCIPLRRDPSLALSTSNTEMRRGSRASVYPPLIPR